MPQKTRTTAFRRWFDAQTPDLDPAVLATRLGCTEGSVRHYLAGRAIPRPGLLRKLTDLTGLSADAFLFPFERGSAAREVRA